MLESRLRRRLTRQDRAALQKGLAAATRAGLPPETYLNAAVQTATFRPEDVDRLGARLSAPLRAILHRRCRSAQAPGAAMRLWRGGNSPPPV